MTSPVIDLNPLERRLHDLVLSIRVTDTEVSWEAVEVTSRELANSLRARNATGEFGLLSVSQALVPTHQSLQLIVIVFSERPNSLRL